MTPARRANLGRLLAPRHAVFIGGETAASAARECAAFGFDGAIWGVNPKRDTLGGAPCFAAVEDLPEAPDAVFLAVPHEGALDVVRALRDRGAGGIVMFTAGFAEVGGDGIAREHALVEAAGDVALVGPNCFGTLNFARGVTLWPYGHGGSRCDRGVAIVSQSGMMGFNLSMNRRSVPMTHFISAGNQSVLAIEDYLDALVDDDAVTAIGLYIEGLKSPMRFARAAMRALEAGKPVVALKGGRSELGARLAMTHTASLSGTDDVYQALFDRLSIIRVFTTIELLETLKFATVAGIPRGNRIAAFTCSGGDATLIVDNAPDGALDFAPPSDAARATLEALLPEIATISNPLDYTTPLWGAGEPVRRVYAALLADGYDAAVMAQDYPRADVDGGRDLYRADTQMFAEAVREAAIPGAVCANLPENLNAEARTAMIEAGLAPMQGIAEALGALAATARYGTARAAALASGTLDLLALREPAAAFGDTASLDEAEAKARLAAAGIPVPEGAVATPDDAPRIARELGFPVAAKLVSAALAHKSEAGAVRLGLASEAEVESAVSAMLQGAAGLDVAGVLVERMVADPIAELLVSVRHEPAFGQVMVLASGGILVDLAGDATTLLLPTSRDAVAAALGSLKVASLLKGYRGRPAADMEAVVATILSIAEFADRARDDLCDLEINPLIATASRTVAVDALMTVRRR